MAGGEARSSALRVLALRNFWPYFAGNLLSNCGTWFQNIAQAILIYRLTGSTFVVGVVNFAQFAGVFLLAPFAGSAADRFDRRRLIVLTQVGAVVVTAALAALQGAGLATAPVVIVLTGLLGVTFALAIPAIQAMVPDLVDTEHLAAALALSSVTFNLARAIGPVVGAVVVARLGIAAAFGLNSLSYLALIAGLLAVRPAQVPRSAGPPPRWRESVRMVRDDVALVALLGVVAAISVTQDPVSTLTPGFSSEVFHRADTLTGVLVGAFGLGAALAAATVAGRPGNPVRRLAPGCACMGLGMLGFAAARTVPVALGSLLLGGFGFMVTNTGATTALTMEAAPEQRGRVMAMWSLGFLGTRPPASLLDGGVASAAGLRTAAVVLTLPVLAAGAAMVVLRRRVPRLREIGIAPLLLGEPPPVEMPGLDGPE
ncbi:MAG TPA: MFS transporter [Acidimicrobiia bacterium]|nr:MFS transporter [Acidimicrobiia bacterium]